MLISFCSRQHCVGEGCFKMVSTPGPRCIFPLSFAGKAFTGPARICRRVFPAYAHHRMIHAILYTWSWSFRMLPIRPLNPLKIAGIFKITPGITITFGLGNMMSCFHKYRKLVNSDFVSIYQEWAECDAVDRDFVRIRSAHTHLENPALYEHHPIRDMGIAGWLLGFHRIAADWNSWLCK